MSSGFFSFEIMIKEEEILNLGFYNANDPFLGRAYYSEQQVYFGPKEKIIATDSIEVDPRYLIIVQPGFEYYTLIIKHSETNQDVQDFVTLKELVDLMNVKEKTKQRTTN